MAGTAAASSGRRAPPSIRRLPARGGLLCCCAALLLKTGLAAAGTDCVIEAVYVDGRASAAATSVFESAAAYLPPGSCLTLYHGCNNGAWARQVADDERFASLAVEAREIPHHFFGRQNCRRRVMISVLLTSPFFWSETERRSERTLILQADSVLCRPLEAEEWSRFAYVGAPWPEGHCRIRHASRNWDGAEGLFPLKTCPQIGNGGFSLRQRRWMLDAIQACPNPWVRAEGKSEACRAQKLLEDEYFAAVLTAMGAPLPSAYDAVHFATEASRWEPSFGLSVEEANALVPVGVHKPWKWLKNETELGVLRRSCEFLDGILPPGIPAGGAR